MNEGFVVVNYSTQLNCLNHPTPLNLFWSDFVLRSKPCTALRRKAVSFIRSAAVLIGVSLRSQLMWNTVLPLANKTWYPLYNSWLVSSTVQSLNWQVATCGGNLDRKKWRKSREYRDLNSSEHANPKGLQLYSLVMPKQVDEVASTLSNSDYFISLESDCIFNAV